MCVTLIRSVNQSFPLTYRASRNINYRYNSPRQSPNKTFPGSRGFTKYSECCVWKTNSAASQGCRLICGIFYTCLYNNYIHVYKGMFAGEIRDEFLFVLAEINLLYSSHDKKWWYGYHWKQENGKGSAPQKRHQFLCFSFFVNKNSISYRK